MPSNQIDQNEVVSQDIQSARAADTAMHKLTAMLLNEVSKHNPGYSELYNEVHKNFDDHFIEEAAKEEKPSRPGFR